MAKANQNNSLKKRNLNSKKTSAILTDPTIRESQLAHFTFDPNFEEHPAAFHMGLV